eukprot:GHVS01059373.1.p2 GENE.GHVS01059373.1~~GHVS01059373.1.p2  ORF type:complete len:226 (+),score=30.71 GHVS01059373.1:541-1218(+)
MAKGVDRTTCAAAKTVTCYQENANRNLQVALLSMTPVVLTLIVATTTAASRVVNQEANAARKPQGNVGLTKTAVPENAKTAIAAGKMEVDADKTVTAAARTATILLADVKLNSQRACHHKAFAILTWSVAITSVVVVVAVGRESAARDCGRHVLLIPAVALDNAQKGDAARIMAKDVDRTTCVAATTVTSYQENAKRNLQVQLLRQTRVCTYIVPRFHAFVLLCT